MSLQALHTWVWAVYPIFPGRSSQPPSDWTGSISKLPSSGRSTGVPQLWEPWSWSQIPYILKYLAIWFMNDWCFKFVLKDSQRPIPKPPQCCLVIVMVREVGLLQSETMLTLEQVFFNYVSVFDCIHSSFSSDQSSCPPLAWCCHQHYAIWFSVVWILVCKGEIVVFDF